MLQSSLSNSVWVWFLYVGFYKMDGDKGTVHSLQHPPSILWWDGEGWWTLDGEKHLLPCSTNIAYNMHMNVIYLSVQLLQDSSVHCRTTKNPLFAPCGHCHHKCIYSPLWDQSKSTRTFKLNWCPNCEVDITGVPKKKRALESSGGVVYTTASDTLHCT